MRERENTKIYISENKGNGSVYQIYSIIAINFFDNPDVIFDIT